MISTIRKFIAATTLAILLASTASAATWTLSKPGNYKMRSNRSVITGDAILITASNVTLDLGGYSVSTQAPGTGRGIVVQGAKGVVIHGGHVGGGLAPNNGPTEIGVLLINSRGCDFSENNISSVNLGIFIRGEHSTGNRIMKNVVSGGATVANNLLGICYNPAPTPGGGVPNPAGPRGDNIYNNTITRFGFAIAVSAGSIQNMFIDNVMASFTGTFREPQFFVAGGGTNVELDNTAVVIPAVATP